MLVQGNALYVVTVRLPPCEASINAVQLLLDSSLPIQRESKVLLVRGWNIGSFRRIVPHCTKIGA